ncbi:MULTISPECIES: diaminobutyrate acetyltransferase [Streptomyces]|uniref:L-2,4-diaminobutyric acid acetyltransferase n=1 Tax=Streptomyces dengpaensis TaxID=2049881 RepID=A0ABN5IB62_9ACTN|nr:MULTISPECIES: diaminobutyrate acetyltransferase [Streptomyces]AVH59445.1 diaminobutyrate acetyltransferase [Streptomyces dengpaensis]PIB05803.1 diaminobutyrate acetyltransferase [Streptomyces sp. HG99]
MTAAQADLQAEFLEMPEGLRIDRPEVSDGAVLWRIAKDSRTLDLNSSYSYLLWCRDFAGTSAVARDADGAPVGFVTGYVRPERPRTLLVWQVAVDGAYRGRGLAAALLDGLTARVAGERGLSVVETTITPGNTASERLFTSYARRHGADVEREVLFEAAQFPDGPHDPEVLYRIGPLFR